ncbi:PIN domain-containing protein [Azohydromonas sediminis]|uniref:PIN domain-containing protein n=1 Tax=Azohydromonas sediminis TaxID=2259674 RepID=UPI000E650B40|nr:PIN domain-containing protein [Azohydromonas sediminis]
MPSGSTVFVDTNVLVYAEDRAHPDKHRAARQWLRELWVRRLGRLSTQVLNEFYVTVTRKLSPAMPPGDARAEVRRFQRWQPWLVDHATVESAWAVESRFGLHFWDALMVASAQQQGCRWLLTEDLQHDQTFDTVQVVNPFVAGPELLDAPAP